MRFRSRLLPQIVCTLALASVTLRADPGDVDSSQDYAGFPRLPGFIISDYDEDNPAEFDFPVAHPLPTDSSHIEMVHVNGHRYVIRYEISPGHHATPLFQTQQYYEKLASDAGYKVVKDGATGDVTETFYRSSGAHQTWVYLEPDVTVNVLTVVESTENPLHPHPPPRLVAATPAPTLPIPAVPAIPTVPVIPMPGVTPSAAVAENPFTAPAPAPTPEPSAKPAPPSNPPPPPEPEPKPSPAVDPNDDSLYQSLSSDGRVIVPFVFQPGKAELDSSSQPQVDRVVAMMSRHPDLFLRIEGHTDNTGDPDANMRLSAERALAIQSALVDADISKKRLDAVGVGGLQPLADNDTAEGREKNRRIELVMWRKYPAFHAPAPNGNNYYPNPGQG